MASKRKAGAGSASGRAKKAKQERVLSQNGRSRVTEPPKTSFLILPTELRVRVYKHLFPNKRVPAMRPKVSDVDEFRQVLRDDGQACHTAIIATCKEIKEEACDVLYGSVAYELNILGSLVRSCMDGGGRTLAQAFLDSLPRHQIWGHNRRARNSKTQAATYDGVLTSLLAYVRNIDLVVEDRSEGGWSRVHSMALRKEMPDRSFAEIFAKHEMPLTVRSVMDSLQKAPKLRSVKISTVYLTRWDQRLSNYKAERVFSAFKNTRFKNVLFGELTSASLKDPLYGSLVTTSGLSEARATFGRLKEDTAQAMASDDPAPETSIDPEDIHSLKQFVRQFHGQPFFHEICKELYDTLGSAAVGDKKSFKRGQERVIAVWEKEEQRLRQLIDSARAPLAGLDCRPRSTDGSESDSDCSNKRRKGKHQKKR